MLRRVLDEDPLEGPHAVRVRLRPERVARPIPAGDGRHFLDAVELSCQVWGGGATPLIPVNRDGVVEPLFAAGLRGSDIDGLLGVDLHQYSASTRIEVPTHPAPWWGQHFAPVALTVNAGSPRPKLTLPVPDRSDPWVGIYAAMFGRLPAQPNPDLLAVGDYLPDLTFDQFIDMTVESVTASLSDLVGRAGRDQFAGTARRLSMAGDKLSANRTSDLGPLRRSLAINV